jgi:hypothetical protein
MKISRIKGTVLDTGEQLYIDNVVMHSLPGIRPYYENGIDKTPYIIKISLSAPYFYKGEAPFFSITVPFSVEPLVVYSGDGYTLIAKDCASVEVVQCLSGERKE